MAALYVCLTVADVELVCSDVCLFGLCVVLRRCGGAIEDAHI